MKSGFLGYVWAGVGALVAVALFLVALSTRYEPLTQVSGVNCISQRGCLVLDRWTGSAYRLDPE